MKEGQRGMTESSGLGGGRFRLLNFCHDRLFEKNCILPMFECSNMILPTRSCRSSSLSSSSLSRSGFFLFFSTQDMRIISPKIAKNIKTTQSTGNTKRLKTAGGDIRSNGKLQSFSIGGFGAVILIKMVVVVAFVTGGGMVEVVRPHLQPRQSNPCSVNETQSIMVGIRRSSQVFPSAFSCLRQIS